MGSGRPSYKDDLLGNIFAYLKERLDKESRLVVADGDGDTEQFESIDTVETGPVRRIVDSWHMPTVSQSDSSEIHPREQAVDGMRGSWEGNELRCRQMDLAKTQAGGRGGVHATRPDVGAWGGLRGFEFQEEDQALLKNVVHTFSGNSTNIHATLMASTIRVRIQSRTICLRMRRIVQRILAGRAFRRRTSSRDGSWADEAALEH